MTGHDRTDGSEQVERYEDLRRHVIGHTGGHRLGRALFQREGMKVWLDAWSTCTTREARPLRDASDEPDRVGTGRIATILNQNGHRSGDGRLFTRKMVVDLVQDNELLKSRYERLRDKGFLTREEMAERLGITPDTVRTWARHGLLRAHPYTDRGQCLYEPPGEYPPRKMQGYKLADRRVYQ